MKRLRLGVITLGMLGFAPLFAKDYNTTVVETRQLTPLIQEIVLQRDPSEGPFAYEAGQYVMVKVPPYEKVMASTLNANSQYESTWQKLGIWKLSALAPAKFTRTYSLANSPDDDKQNRLRLNVRLATPEAGSNYGLLGLGSAYMWKLKKGDKLVVAGPYGKFKVEDRQDTVVYIAKSSGLAPIRAHIHHRLRTLKDKNPLHLLYVAHGVEDLYYTDELNELSKQYSHFKWHYFVKQSEPSFERHLDKWIAQQSNKSRLAFYLCGPQTIINQASAILKKHDISAERIHLDNFGGIKKNQNVEGGAK